MAKIKTQNCQILTTIINGILKFKPMNKKAIGADNTFFTVNTFSGLKSFT